MRTGTKARVVAILAMLPLSVQLTGCAAMFHGTSDQITVQSADSEAKIYLDNNLIGKGTAVASVKRNTTHTVAAKKRGCADNLAQTQNSFDAVSLLGLIVDGGLISMLVIDWGATGAMWKTEPLVYHVTPVCDEQEPAISSSVPDRSDSLARDHQPSVSRPSEMAKRRNGKSNAPCFVTAKGVICREQNLNSR